MSFTCTIKVTPRSKKLRWHLDSRGQLHFFLKSPPENGKANSELIALIAKILHIAQSKIAIIRGNRIRTKVISITSEYSYEDFLSACGIEYQKKIF